ncbi:bifunctional folylpolyglutamate synthase/dihydrofolate synthase [Paenibacillus puerhi]|uniref:bifunctional folylpolyglutamate synthase/dihydrofolate synthase n=1 Tax=Paenibacillus puerhi TaxID=2692622 RepID=UPI0013586E92|nr:folylpolyglutamate synthase/dihydrofolate synthase family protein [Paenibacillus puerhi]
MTIEGNEAAQAPFTSAREAVDWIVRFIPLAGIKFGLDRMERLMELLDNPHRRLKFIHVAGTNGKGSVCAYLTEALHSAGYDVGTFTSPYIETYHERIRVNGQNISDEDLLETVNKVKPLVDRVAEEYGQPSMFEISTVVAIEYFARTAYPDFVVWETGMGGRLDSTNVVTPLVSVITNIGHDHMEFLGDSLALIAGEKAGIIKAGVPVITAVDQPEALAVIEEKAAQKKSRVYVLGREYKTELLRRGENEQVFHFDGLFRRIPDVAISMNGAHQVKNAAVALMTLEVLRQYYALIVDDEVLYRALRAAQWPGRLEQVAAEPRILIDGAHNPEGAETLAAALTDTYKYGKLHFMMGMLSNKNHTGYFRHILPIVDTLILTEPDWLKKASAMELAELAKRMLTELGREHVEIVIEPDWKQALDRLTRMTGQDDLAVVSGTLYLIGDVRSWIKHQSDSEKGW